MNGLLISPAYPQTFWSFDRVLNMLGKQALLPPLGLITVAALLPDNWHLRLADLAVRDFREEDWEGVDVVLITGMVNQHDGIMACIREAKRRGKRVVVGGPMIFHGTDEAFEAGADIIVQGELEGIVDELVDAVESEASGVTLRVGERPDLSRSPNPRWDLLELDAYVDMPIQFSRGCPFRCEFCDITLMFGRAMRTKSPDRILAELQSLYDLGWRRAVFFVDDNFIGNQVRAKKLLKRLIPWMEERGHPFDFYTQASVNLASEPELMDLMVRAGFWRVFLGIETPDKDSLEKAGKHQNTLVDLDVACGRINEAGFQIIAGCIIGMDEEPDGMDEVLIDFAVRNDIPEMFMTLLHAVPGTDLWKRLGKEGRLRPSAFTDRFGSQTGVTNFVPSRPLGRIVREFVRSYDALYDSGAYLDRTYNHFRKMGRVPFKKGFSAPKPSEIRAVLITLFRQGVLYKSRWKFWKYFFSSLVRFPDRSRQYLASCVTGEHYFEFRHTVKRELEAELEHIDAEAEADDPGAHAACSGTHR